jgi:hypothetical protein
MDCKRNGSRRVGRPGWLELPLHHALHDGVNKRSASLEELNGLFVLLSSLAGLEGAEIAALPGLWILLSRIESIFTGF